MAFIRSVVNSLVMNIETHVDIYIPTDRLKDRTRKPDGIIYFLHGIGSSEEDFAEQSAAARYARDNTLVMVYPYGLQSFWHDMKYGPKYFTYITEELPELLKAVYGLEFPREKTFIAGLSMGGYGAMYIGMSRPDLYGGIANFSGAVDIRMMAEEIKKMDNIEGDSRAFVQVFGDDLEVGDDRDLFCLAEKISKLPKEQQPRIFSCCGRQDDLFFLHDQNMKLKTYMEGLGLADYVYREWDGIHEYAFWDRALVHAIAFFLRNDYDEKTLAHWRCE